MANDPREDPPRPATGSARGPRPSPPHRADRAAAADPGAADPSRLRAATLSEAFTIRNRVQREQMGMPPDAEHVFRSMAVGVARPRGAAAGIDDAFEGLWTGTKGALRATTHWHMKSRAGTVGRAGLGPLLGRIHASRPEVTIHLIGHSFGARVVAFALGGLPPGSTGPPHP
jgi:hypothetical protein